MIVILRQALAPLKQLFGLYVFALSHVLYRQHVANVANLDADARELTSNTHVRNSLST